MAIREKLRRHLTRTTSASDPNALTTTATSDSKKSKSSKQKAAKDPNRYAPGEMPKPKYRGPYNKAHQEKLHAFSFGEALDNARRKSSQSQYSPRGSKMPSRRGSLVGRFLGGNKRTGSKSGEEGLRESEKEEGGVENGEPGPFYFAPLCHSLFHHGHCIFGIPSHEYAWLMLDVPHSWPLPPTHA